MIASSLSNRIGRVMRMITASNKKASVNHGKESSKLIISANLSSIAHFIIIQRQSTQSTIIVIAGH